MCDCMYTYVNVWKMLQMLLRIGKKIPEKMQNNYLHFFACVCVFVRSVSKYLYLPHKYIQTCIQLHAIL